MKKLALVALAGVVVWFGGVAVWRAFDSEETRIRRLLAECVDAFNARSAGGVLDGFAQAYRDATTGVDRETLRGALLYLTLRARDGVRYHVVLDDASLRLTIDETTAQATFALALYRSRADGPEQLQWALTVDAELAKGDRWLITGSRHETGSGGAPR